MKRYIGLLLLPGLAFAQAPPKADDLAVTEGMLLTEMSAHRDWQARAIMLDRQLSEIAGKLTEAQKRVADLSNAPAPACIVKPPGDVRARPSEAE